MKTRRVAKSTKLPCCWNSYFAAPAPAVTYGVSARGIQAKRLMRRPEGSNAKRTLAVRLYSSREVVCVIGCNWWSTKSRYWEPFSDWLNSSPTTTSMRGVTATPKRPPSTGVLNAFLSRVSWSVMKSQRSVPVLAKRNPVSKPK